MDLRMIDLRTVETGVRLTDAERVEAQMRHVRAANAANLAAKKALNRRMGLTPMVIGALYVPPHISKHFQHSDTVGGTR